jgi:uncharacterized membrane protein
MDEGTIGIIELIFISIVISLILHIYYKNYTNTSFISGILSIIIFLIYAHIMSGPEKFLLIAFFVGGLLSISISFIVGGIVYAVKKYVMRK